MLSFIGEVFSFLVSISGGDPAPDFFPRVLIGIIGIFAIGVTILVCWAGWKFAGIILDWLNSWYMDFKGRYQRRQARVRHERVQRETNISRRRERQSRIINYSEDEGLRRSLRRFIEQRHPRTRNFGDGDFDDYLERYLDNRRNLEAVRNHIMGYLREQATESMREDYEEPRDEDSEYLERIGLSNSNRRRGGRGGGGITIVG